MIHLLSSLMEGMLHQVVDLGMYISSMYALFQVMNFQIIGSLSFRVASSSCCVCVFFPQICDAVCF